MRNKICAMRKKPHIHLCKNKNENKSIREALTNLNTIILDLAWSQLTWKNTLIGIASKYNAALLIAEWILRLCHAYNQTIITAVLVHVAN